MLVYSSLLALVVVGGAPYWLGRMALSGRYRAGLRERLGRLPKAVQEACAGREVVWLHAVSVGEVLAAVRLVGELKAARPGLVVAVSTTTETGQRLARERFRDAPVFYLPLDFGFLMRRYLRVLRPRLVVLMESELWPNMIRACSRSGVPLAVANARVSDRSFPRYLRLRRLWGPLLREVSIFLAQSEETAERLRAIGVPAERVRCVGNLKYDMPHPGQSPVVQLVRAAVGSRPVVIAGSTVADNGHEEEALLMQYWPSVLQSVPEAVLVVAPRHPNRFADAYSLLCPLGTVRFTDLLTGTAAPVQQGGNILLDTVGDLAALYELADVAFIGGSLVRKGGHNPLEAARFGVPVLMGPSFENFRDVVERMQAVDGICILEDRQQLDHALIKLLNDGAWASGVGKRGQMVFQQQAGATALTVKELLDSLE